MKTLTEGSHWLPVAPIYDWGSESLSTTRVVVGRVSLPEPQKPYFVDFTYESREELGHGAIAANKFDATEDAYAVLERAIATLGLPSDAIADRNVLYCKSAAFHDDSAFNTVLVTALWHGTSGDVIFPRMGVKVAMQPGIFLAFDSHEPHCFVEPGAERWEEGAYADAGYSHFLNFDLDRLHPEVRNVFQLRETPVKPANSVCTRGLTICPATGRYLNRAAASF